jgi:hypothetical protein
MVLEDLPECGALAGLDGEALGNEIFHLCNGRNKSALQAIGNGGERIPELRLSLEGKESWARTICSSCSKGMSPQTMS